MDIHVELIDELAYDTLVRGHFLVPTPVPCGENVEASGK